MKSRTSKGCPGGHLVSAKAVADARIAVAVYTEASTSLALALLELLQAVYAAETDPAHIAPMVRLAVEKSGALQAMHGKLVELLLPAPPTPLKSSSGTSFH